MILSSLLIFFYYSNISLSDEVTKLKNELEKEKKEKELVIKG